MMDEEKMDSTDIDQQMVMEAYVMGIPDMSAEEINELLKGVTPGYKLKGSTARFVYHSGTLYLYDRNDEGIARFYEQNRSLVLQQSEAVAALILNIDRLQNALSVRQLSQLIYAAKAGHGERVRRVLRQLEPFYAGDLKSKYKFQLLMENIEETYKDRHLADIIDSDDEDSKSEDWDEDDFNRVSYRPIHQQDISELRLSGKVMKAIHGFQRRYQYRAQLKQHGLPWGNRILLAGPPGNGKSALAGALAKKMELPIYFADMSSIRASLIGETGENVGILFKGVKHLHPDGACVLFLDECDSMATRRIYEKGPDKEDSASLNVMLTMLDQVNENTIIIAATNSADELDPAFVRRFSMELWLAPPTPKARKAFIRHYEKQHEISFTDEEWKQAEALDGKPWAKVKEFCQEIHTNRIVGSKLISKTGWIGKDTGTDGPETRARIGFCRD